MNFNKLDDRFIFWLQNIIGVFLIVIGTAIIANWRVVGPILNFISFLKGRTSAPHWPEKLYLLGLYTLVIGIVIVVINMFLLLQRNRIIPLKQKRIYLTMASIGEILLIWLFIIVNQFSFSYIDNEVDYLPFAKQFVNQDWLSNDWFLNLEIGYKYLFNIIFGNFISSIGFENGAYLGRIFTYLVFSIALFILLRTLHLKLWFGLLILMLFLNQQSLIAGEWMLGGFETKPFSYAFVLLSFSFFFRKRYLWAFAFAGAAISFHILVGVFALFCLIIATLLNRIWVSDWRQLVNNSWPFFITGSIGLLVITENLFSERYVDAIRAWEIYVKFRLPHHVLPSAWSGDHWVIKLIYAICLFIIIYLFGKSKEARFVAAYSLGSVLLFVFGLLLFAWGKMHLLRYYWFRFPDVMVPFMSAVLITLIIRDLSDGLYKIPVVPHDIQRIFINLFKRFVPIVLITLTLVMFFNSYYELHVGYGNLLKKKISSKQEAFEWISENTLNQSIFLVDPMMSGFYVHAERAMFVSFKHFPMMAPDIIEWYERIKICNGFRTPKNAGYNVREEISTNFYNLEYDQIKEIALAYRIDYYLGYTSQELDFESEYSNSEFTLYKVNSFEN